MTTALLFMFFGFLAVAVLGVFLYLQQERILKTVLALRDEHARLHLMIRALESRLAVLENPKVAEERKEGKGIFTETDALLNLNFQKVQNELQTSRLDPELDIHLDLPAGR